MFARPVLLSLALVSVALPLSAKPLRSYSQSNYSAQMQCQDVAGVSRQLQEWTLSHEARVVHASTDSANSRGNLNLRLTEQQMVEFTQKLPQLGHLVSENLSCSDNTATVSENRRQLALLEKMVSSRVEVHSGVLSEVERGLCEAEFKAYLRDRISSCRSTLNNCEANEGSVEVNLTLTGFEASPLTVQGRRPSSAVAPVVDEVAEPLKQNSTTEVSHGLAPFAALLGIAALFGVLTFHRSRRHSAVADEVSSQCSGLSKK